jgi:glycosyltransferase involved in cell wall biosynthesis
MEINSYTTKNGHNLVYTGQPNFELLEILVLGPGDCWHSSFEQGYKNSLSEVVYQCNVAWWYVKDFDNLDECISWRLNSAAFVMRKEIWEHFGGFDSDYESNTMKGLALGFDLIRNGGVVLYKKSLFNSTKIAIKPYTSNDLFIFFRKKFRSEHANYLFLRKGIFNINYWISYFVTIGKYSMQENKIIEGRKLLPVQGKPTVSIVIPTMMRQEMTHQLLLDLNAQTYKPTTVIVVDATPEANRELHWYDEKLFDFNLKIQWQTSKGSCRARNEAINLSQDDYIIFADDDIRILPEYVENHLRFLQTYNAQACNGLDIQADDFKQDLNDLKRKTKQLPPERFKVGITSSFNNANSCVLRKHVTTLGGNDVNYDGGYGEDGDFGMSLVKNGVIVMHNPYSSNLHLKPISGGYRWWGEQAKVLGKQRKKQPWELDTPVGLIRPVPSPTVMYQILKQFDNEAQKEYKIKYFLYHFIKGKKTDIPMKLLLLPLKIIQYNRSIFYAKKLINIGVRNV